MKSIKLLILLVSIQLVSCKQYLYNKYNVTNPKIETKENLMDYLKSQGVSTSRVFYFKNLKSMAKFQKELSLTFPDAFFFNKKGNYISYKKTANDCSAKISGFINDLQSISNEEGDTLINIKKIDELLVSNNKEHITTENNDISVIITFVKYAGNLNKEKAFHWTRLLDSISTSSNIKIEYFLISGDFMQSWDVKENDLPKIR